MNAEQAYLFRHALLRDAGYQLQLPGDRARLHALAFEVIEELAGGRPPESAPLGSPEAATFHPHASDPFAADLADHALIALTARGAAAAGVDRFALGAERRLYLRRAAEHAERNYRFDEATSHWQSYADVVEGGEKGESLHRAGRAAGSSGRFTNGISICMRALAIHRETGDRHAEAVSLQSVSIYHKHAGRNQEAEKGYEQSLAIFREVGDRRSEGSALNNLAILYLDTDRVEQAERNYEQALAIHRELGRRGQEGVTLGNLANLYRKTGRVQQAEEGHLQSLAIQREVGDRRSEGIALANLADLFHSTDRGEKAEEYYAQAMAIHREVGNRRYESYALVDLASLLKDAGRVKPSEHTYRKALALLRELGDRRTEGMCLCSFAELMMDLGRTDAAREAWHSGTSILREFDDTAELRRRIDSMRKSCDKSGNPALPEHPA